MFRGLLNKSMWPALRLRCYISQGFSAFDKQEKLTTSIPLISGLKMRDFNKQNFQINILVLHIARPVLFIPQRVKRVDFFLLLLNVLPAYLSCLGWLNVFCSSSVKMFSNFADVVSTTKFRNIICTTNFRQQFCFSSCVGDKIIIIIIIIFFKVGNLQ